VTTVKTVMGQLASKVKSWRFSRALVRAEKRPANIATIVSHVELNWRVGMTAVLGHLNNNKPTHKDWTK
jgi:hypothetical protein